MEHLENPAPEASRTADVVGPLALAALFFAVFVFFDMRLYFGLVLIFVGLMQVFPLSAKFIDNLVLFCAPVIGAIANCHHVCLTYNSIVLFMLCRAYAVYGQVRTRDVVTFFLMMASWPFYFVDSNHITYAGAILHGIVSPMSFYLYTRRSRLVQLGVFAVPGIFLIDNIILYKQWFVAFWDFEILCVYFFWMLGFDKRVVVQKVLMCSLPLITFLQMYWPICPTKGYLVEAVFAFLKSWL